MYGDNMAGTLKKVRFIKAWQNYCVGDEITPSGTLRDWLKDRGYIEIAGESSPVRRNGVNRMAVASNRRGR
jgi:hypothetical protein